jgi:translation initiation factor 2 alpha subunit (eIF-2alpha)
MELEEDQIVLCTVDKVIGTTVFVKINDTQEATITTSEIAPGRIRNLRDYVAPGKKIVCKVLSTKPSIHLSLRRVKKNERKELLDYVDREKAYTAILNTVFGKENSPQLKEKITEDYSLIDFFDGIKNDKSLLLKYMDKENAEKIIKILESKKEKAKETKQIIKLSSKENNGIVIVKKIIEEACQNSKCNVNYIAAGKYSFGLLGEDFKDLKTQMNKILEIIEHRAKKQNCEFSIEKG